MGSVPTPTIIIPGQSIPSSTTHFSLLYNWAGSEKGWITNELWKQWVIEVFIPFIIKYRLTLPEILRDQPVVLFSDGHGSRGGYFPCTYQSYSSTVGCWCALSLENIPQKFPQKGKGRQEFVFHSSVSRAYLEVSALCITNIPCEHICGTSVGKVGIVPMAPKCCLVGLDESANTNSRGAEGRSE